TSGSARDKSDCPSLTVGSAIPLARCAVEGFQRLLHQLVNSVVKTFDVVNQSADGHSGQVFSNRVVHRPLNQFVLFDDHGQAEAALLARSTCPDLPPCVPRARSEGPTTAVRPFRCL